MLQIYVNVLPSSATPRFLSLYHKILPLFMPVHMFKLIFVYYKDNTVSSNQPQVDQYICQLTSQVHFSRGSFTHSCIHKQNQPPNPAGLTATFG